jgi:hypothetical protein
MEFYPANAPIPDKKQTERLLLRPLRAADVDLDYDAVMTSAAMLRQWSQSSWPADDFTLAENLDDLQRHEREHIERKAFTYTVMEPDETRCLGCVYITPVWPQALQACEGATYAAGVGFWVRAAEISHDLDKHLLSTLLAWFAADWLFDCLAFSNSPQDERQTTIFHEANLRQRSAFTSPGGRHWFVFD